MDNYQHIISNNLHLLKAITQPYALSAQHVQGPGGNTSVKDGDTMLLKASGYTFKNVADDNGVVLINLPEVIEGINTKQAPAHNTAVALPAALATLPEAAALKPSMEYEFHALLDTFVLHTHSIATNVINCSENTHALYEHLFTGTAYEVVPYVTPGYPIAAALLNIKQRKGSIAPVIFLKNHGIIIHADTQEAVTDIYNYIEHQIYTWLQAAPFTESIVETVGDNYYRIDNLYGTFDFRNAVEILEHQVLIPDQTIFFKDKVSTTQADAPVYVNTDTKEIFVNGGEKFANACAQMLQAIQFVLTNQQRLGLKPEYLHSDAIAELHNLPAEKHRTQLLKN